MTRILLDTHTFLWFITDDPQLSDLARTEIEGLDTEVFLSVDSLWEIAIKVSLSKLPLPAPFETFILHQLSANDIQLLDISFANTARVSMLPFFHKVPFDRLLAAQSIEETIPLISADTAFDAYGVHRIW
jgi:PIN domain nuclease of toxin-antitoxin system